MTELPINCCPGSTTPVSDHCIAEDYLMRHCPILKEVNKASKHACPLKEGCRLYRMLMKEEKEEEQDVKKM